MGLVYILLKKNLALFFFIAFHSIDDMFSLLLLNTETHIHSRVRLHGIFVGQNGCGMSVSKQFVSSLPL